MSRRRAGYTLLEVVVAMAIFGIFLMVLGLLTSEMHRQEKRMPVNFMRHPQITAVLSRLRRDVVDAELDPYLEEHDGYKQGQKTLIVRTLVGGARQIVVWDFSVEGQATRRAYNVGVATDWVARGLPPEFSSEVKFDAVDMPGREWGVRVTARDEEGTIAIDQIYQPRAYR